MSDNNIKFIFDLSNNISSEEISAETKNLKEDDFSLKKLFSLINVTYLSLASAFIGAVILYSYLNSINYLELFLDMFEYNLFISLTVFFLFFYVVIPLLYFYFPIFYFNNAVRKSEIDKLSVAIQRITFLQYSVGVFVTTIFLVFIDTTDLSFLEKIMRNVIYFDNLSLEEYYLYSILTIIFIIGIILELVKKIFFRAGFSLEHVILILTGWVLCMLLFIIMRIYKGFTLFSFSTLLLIFSYFSFASNLSVKKKKDRIALFFVFFISFIFVSITNPFHIETNFAAKTMQAIGLSDSKYYVYNLDDELKKDIEVTEEYVCGKIIMRNSNVYIMEIKSNKYFIPKENVKLYKGNKIECSQPK